jgi:ABC-type sugar transport system substrate-binding protein
MKKQLTAILCTGALVLGLLSASLVMAEDTGSTEGIQASPEFYATADLSVLEGKKIGITIQSLENAYWAGVMTALQEQLDEIGANTTIVACDDSSATQIGQVENFISSGCDLIMIHPSDAAAVEDVAKEAQDAGIKVMCWDDPMTNTDGNWILNNTDLGIAIGELAGEFINQYYDEDNKAEVTVIGYPQTTILKEREEGILQGMANIADGKYEVVANQAAIDANAAQTAMETILIAHPDCKVVAGIGAGAMIGADEALNISTGGKIPEDMGVFTTDVTKQQLEQLNDETYPAKGIIGFEGSDEDTANACASMFALILSDSLEAQNVFRGVAPITAENVAEISAGMK